MSMALALINPTEYEIMAKLARVAAGSGYVGKNEVQAMFIMLKGMELGISPMQALDGIQVIQNKTTVSPQLMLALINRSGELQDLQIDDPDTIKANKACKVVMTRRGRSPHTEIFSMEDAESMKLAGKDNWLKQPAVMLKWRAVSACARIVFPDVIQGMYTPEEMGAEVSEDQSGNIVIEAPLLDADFTKSENEVAQLTANNPLNADEDGIIPNVEATPSDLQAETDQVPTTAETAKSRFAGNGAPPTGQKKESDTREWIASAVTVRKDKFDKPYLQYVCTEGKPTGRGREMLRQAGYECEAWTVAGETYDLVPPAALTVQKSGQFWNVIELRSTVSEVSF